MCWRQIGSHGVDEATCWGQAADRRADETHIRIDISGKSFTARNMNWTQEQIEHLTELHQGHTLLWDPTDAWDKNKIKRTDAWIDIGKVLQVGNGYAANKMKNLIAKFGRELKKKNPAMELKKVVRLQPFLTIMFINSVAYIVKGLYLTRQ